MKGKKFEICNLKFVIGAMRPAIVEKDFEKI
jgi:hypothetical protein